MTPNTTERAPPAIHLTPDDAGRRLTLEQFERADVRGGYRYELIGGRLVVSPVPNLPHDDVVEWVAEALRAYAREHPEVINRVKSPARVFPESSEPEVPDAPEPDVACFENYPTHLPIARRAWRDLSPLIVVEVLSADNADKDRERNVELYLGLESVREYWIIDPLKDADRPTLTVYRRRGRAWQKPIRVKFGKTYATRQLPGFSLVIDPSTYQG